MTDGPFSGFGFGDVAERLGAGGYEVVYETDRLQVGVYVLAAPEPDTQQPHEWDELYFVLEGRGTLDVEGEKHPSSRVRQPSSPPTRRTASRATSGSSCSSSSTRRRGGHAPPGLLVSYICI
jgi:hypothetical protein